MTHSLFRPPSAGKPPYSLGEKADAALAQDPGTRALWRPQEQSPKGQGYHGNSNAETYYLIGEAMSGAMKRLINAR